MEYPGVDEVSTADTRRAAGSMQTDSKTGGKGGGGRGAGRVTQALGSLGPYTLLLASHECWSLSLKMHVLVQTFNSYV